VSESLLARRRLVDQQGAVVVQAAVGMMALLAMSAFVVDYGVLWLSRQQAQNAADAGAVSAAVALAYDEPSYPPPAGGIVEQSAMQLVASNPVWFSAAVPAVSYACPPELGTSVPCVRVDVYRDGTSGSTAIPTFFGPVLGIMSQSVRATATAQVAIGNGTTCLKPWAIPDKWIEHRPVDKAWEPGDVFEKYVEPGPGTLLVPADEYLGPVDGGEGMTVGLDLGLQLSLTFADPDANAPITPGLLLPLLLPGPNSYDENISGCNSHLSLFAEQFPTGSSSLLGATASGFADLIAADSLATWDPGTNSVQNSCAPGPCGAISPRLVPIVLFDVDQYQLMRATDNWCPGNIRCVKVANIVGFFIESASGIGAVGYVARYPGLVSPGNPSLSAASSFLPAVTLVR
jgi:Putative Flp pilus-assembly TadE/G-like